MARVPSKFPEGLRVLAVDHDLTTLEFINQMCFQCNYHVVPFYDSPLALDFVREKKDFIDLILIEVHMPKMNGYDFLKSVGMEINVPVIMMSFDDTKSVVMKAIEEGACDYWIKPLHPNQFKIMWKHVAKKVWDQNKLPRIDNFEVASSIVDATLRNPKQKNFNSKESDAAKLDDLYAQPSKKPRLMWSEELHCLFVNAVMQIGLENARPMMILEVMNIPGLTREHVASHLQKFRLYLKKYNGGTLQENQMSLPNTIPETTQSIAYPTFDDFQGFDGSSTSHAPYGTMDYYPSF